MGSARWWRLVYYVKSAHWYWNLYKKLIITRVATCIEPITSPCRVEQPSDIRALKITRCWAGRIIHWLASMTYNQAKALFSRLTNTIATSWTTSMMMTFASKIKIIVWVNSLELCQSMAIFSKSNSASSVPLLTPASKASPTGKTNTEQSADDFSKLNRK